MDNDTKSFSGSAYQRPRPVNLAHRLLNQTRPFTSESEAYDIQ